MKTSGFISRILVLVLLLACLALVCNSMDRFPAAPTAAPTPTPAFTPIPSATPSPAPAPTAVLDSGWFLLQPGLERRKIDLYRGTDQVEALYLLRLDPSLFQLDVAYHAIPQNLEDWQKETNALVVVNGGYFSIENERPIPNGLTIVNGQAFGSTYGSFGGMLAITDYGAEVRWLAEKPYDPSEPLRAALQSFPVLVKPGGVLGFPEEHEDNLKARRTVIGQDRNGRLLFLIAPRGHFTLHQLSLYLTTSDLDLHIALNLDGGPSSGIFLANPREIIPAQTLSPIVILVYGP